MSAPRKLTDAKKAQIGVKGYYNVDKDSFVAKTAKAVEQGTKKGLLYDPEYGLVATDRAVITAFIQANGLSPLPPGLIDGSNEAVAAPGSPAAAAPAAASSSYSLAPVPAAAAAAPASTVAIGSAQSSTVVTPTKKSPANATFLDRVRTKLETVSSGKFLNLSTMREVKGDKAGLEYNKSYRLAAKSEDSRLLRETVEALGGSPNGGQLAPQEQEDAVPPPTSNRVRSAVIYNRTVFGTADALAQAREAASSEESKQVEPAEPSSAKRTPVEIRPSTGALTRPVFNSLPIAAKPQMPSSFALAKPQARV